MNVASRQFMEGWWRAAEGLAGLMGKPENPDNFIRFPAEDLIIYIEKNALEDDDKEIIFKVHNYGEFIIVFHW